MAAASCKLLPCSAAPVMRLRPQIRIAHFTPVSRSAPRRVVVCRTARSPPVSVRKSKLQVGATATVLTGGRAVAGSSIRDRTAQLQHAIHNPEPPKAGGAASKVGIVWFRSDLRTDDNEALFTAHARCSAVLPVYCIDPRDYGKSAAGFDKVGPYKAKFLLEALADLRARLRDAGSDLMIARGKPEEVLPAVAKSVGATAIYAHADVTEEDCLAERNVRSAAEAAGAPLKLFWGSTLYHLDDLPFTVPAMPTSYGPFREKVVACAVREALKQPSERRGLPAGSPDPGEIPTLAQLGISELPKGSGPSGGLCGAGALVGGETEALRRLQAFLSEGPGAGCAGCSGGGGKATPGRAAAGRAGAAGGSPCGANFSCKVSPWLALGCLSPRRMYWDLKRATEKAGGSGAPGAAVAKGGAQGGLQWLVFELLWRDFFRLTTLKYAQTKAREALTAAPAGAAGAGAGSSRPMARAPQLEQLGEAPAAPPVRATAFAAGAAQSKGAPRLAEAVA